MSKIEEFNEYRTKMNDQILGADNLLIKRIFNLDSGAFKDGAVDQGTKELVGLACSMVLRCDDCVKYHIMRSVEAGYDKKQIFEIFAIASLIGGTIVIPHLRRATEFLDELLADPASQAKEA